jgi:hypothetical protein
MPRGRAGKKSVLLSIVGVALIALLAVGPIEEARAYVDPNSAGPLFQFLFPLFIAITSALAACRRMIAQLWRRATGTIRAAVRGESSSSDFEDRIDPS